MPFSIFLTGARPRSAWCNAAARKVAVEAMRYLEAIPEQRAGVHIHGNVGAIAGYVINLEGEAAPPRLGGSTVIEHASFTSESFASEPNAMDR